MDSSEEPTGTPFPQSETASSTSVPDQAAATAGADVQAQTPPQTLPVPPPGAASSTSVPDQATATAGADVQAQTPPQTLPVPPPEAASSTSVPDQAAATAGVDVQPQTPPQTLSVPPREAASSTSVPDQAAATAGVDVQPQTPPQTLPVPTSGGGRKPPPPPSGGDGGDDEEDGMLRMSFLEHLEELRSRLIKMVVGIGVAFVLCLTFTDRLWAFVVQPAAQALKTLGYTPSLVQIAPMESFNIIWMKLPIYCALFVASPWILYQVWAFISPGLYRRERRWAAPFVLCSAGLFILGGVFAYFVAFRYGLTFLLSIGKGNYVTPMVSLSEYFDLFINVTLGVALVFELPVLIFFLTLLRVVSPSFLLNHSRYAILIIFIVAAIVTPTPDVFNLMLFATPMCMLFFVGIFASYLLVLSREGRRFPWGKALTVVGIVLLVLAGMLYLAITRYGLKLIPHWPFLAR